MDFELLERLRLEALEKAEGNQNVEMIINMFVDNFKQLEGIRNSDSKSVEGDQRQISRGE